MMQVLLLFTHGSPRSGRDERGWSGLFIDNCCSSSHISRYSTGDYVSSLDQLQFNMKGGGHQNNAYVAYVDYSRDYNPPSAAAIQQKPLNTSSSPVTTATTAATNSANTSYGGSSQQLYSTPGMYSATDGGHGGNSNNNNNKHLTQDNGLPIMQNNLNMMHQNHLLSEYCTETGQAKGLGVAGRNSKLP